MSALEWCDPPPPQSKKWFHVAVELSERPGEWARVVRDVEPAYAYQTVAKSLRRHGCEVTSRRKGEQVSVWARVPDEWGEE